MAGKNRAVSPLSNGSYESNYSDDFEDDDAHSNRRYKTRSPALRTGMWHPHTLTSLFIISASTRKSLSSWIPSKQDSNQSPQLQRLARKLEFPL